MSNNIVTPEKSYIETQCKTLLIKQLSVTSVVSVIGAIILVIVLQDEVKQTLLTGWLMMMIAVNLVRFILAFNTQGKHVTINKGNQYYWLLIALTAGVGCIWGVGGLLFLQQTSLPYQVFITFIIGGMAAGAVATYTASVIAYTVFSFSAGLPISLWLVLQTGNIHQAMGIMTLIFIATLWISVRQQHKTLCGSLKLQFEKEALIAELEHRAETIEAAHQALLDSEEKYCDLYDNAPDMYLSVDTQTMTIKQCNQTLVDKLGYETDSGKDNIIGQSIFDVYHPDCHEELKRTCKIFMETGKISNISLLLQDKDSAAIDVMLNASAVRDDSGAILYSRSSLRDIREHKIQEKFETDQRKILQKIIDKSVPLTDILDDVISAIQGQVPEMVGSILLLDETGKYLHHGAAPNLAEGYCRAIDGGEIGPAAGSCGTAAFSKQRVIVTDIANDPLWANYKALAKKYALAACWSQPIINADNRVLGTFAMYYQQPRTPNEREIKLIEQASALTAIVLMRRQEEQEIGRLAAILQATPDFVGMSDIHGRIIFVNQAGRLMLGYGEDEDLSMLTIEDFHPPENMQHEIEKVLPILKKTGIWRGQTDFISKNGQTIITDQVLITHRNEAGEITHYASIARDISEQLKAEEERVALQSQLDHTQRLESLGVLAGGIAHDFNNILTAIMGNASLAEQKVLSHPQDTQKYMANIVAASERAAELCKQMLAYSGKGKFVVKALNLSSLVEEITRLLEVSITKNIVLKYHLMENLPAVEADGAQIQQVIMNLIMNASDAIGEKSGVISIATGLMKADSAYLASSGLNNALPEGTYAYLEINDTGCGMETSLQEKIFEPFFTTKFTGHGLGMSAVLGIVRSHQGTIKVSSQLNSGSTFKVLLPICEQAADRLPANIEGREREQGTGTILIVDDEESIREIAVIILEDMGYSTLTAVDGEDAVNIYREHQDDITAVLLDLTMPNMNGETCFTKLQGINSEVKVVICSGYNEIESTSRFSGQGLAGFIQKPYLPDALQKKLQAIL